MLTDAHNDNQIVAFCLETKARQLLLWATWCKSCATHPIQFIHDI